MKPLRQTIAVLLFAGLFNSQTSPAQTRDGNFWYPNNSVRAIRVDDSRDRVFIGGSFTYIGQNTGNQVLLNKTTGILDPSFPKANETVAAAVADGAGGLFIGGYFTQIGGVSRNNLAHINSAGVVTNWDPNPNGGVSALAVHNGILYVGGSFTSIDGHNRSCIASFDAATRTYRSSWEPDTIHGEYYSSVERILPYGGKVYVAGSFDTIGTSARNSIAAFDMGTAALSAWDPAPTHWTNEYSLSVAAMSANEGTLFIGGSFTSIGGVNRRSIAQVDTATGAATSWNADIYPYIVSGFFAAETTSNVRTMYRKGDSLYVSGNFRGFQSTESFSFALLHASDGSLVSNGAPAMVQYESASTLFVEGSTMYVGGEFTSLGGNARKNLAAFSLSTGVVSSWDPKLSSSPNTFALFGTGLYVGGDFYSANGEVRNGIASYVQSTGMLTSWNPNVTTTDGETSINDILIADTTVYLAGRFNELNGNPRYGLAAVGIAGGAVLPFAPEMKKYNMFSGSSSPEMYALAANSTTLFVGGHFDSVGTASRTGAAAFLHADGSLSSWDPNPMSGSESADIYALAVSGNKVFLGGNFDAAGDSARNNLASVDTVNGSILGWDPDLDGSVYSLKADGATLYAGGSFSSANGVSRDNLAAFDTSSAVPAAWNPSSNSSVEDIDVTLSAVYVVGFFDAIGGGTRYSAAALDKTTGTATLWDPQLSSGDMAGAIGVSTAHQKVYMGGDFTTVLGDYSDGFGVVDNPFDATLPVELVSFRASVTGRNVHLTWNTAAEVSNYGFEIERRSTDTGTLNTDHWSTIGFVEGNGTVNAPKSYSFTDVLVQGRASYRLKQIDKNGSFTYSQAVEVRAGDAPSTYALEQNYPNPFNPSTTLRYAVPERSSVSLTVYNTVGQVVAHMVSGIKDAGFHESLFDASHLSSGVYFYRIEAVSEQDPGRVFINTRKMVLMR